MNERTKQGNYEINIKMIQESKGINEEEGEVNKLVKVWYYWQHH
jgi:hypothetical protein